MLPAPGPSAAATTESKPARFPQLTMEQLNEQQKAVAKEFLKVSSGGLGGPYNVLLTFPDFSPPAPERICDSDTGKTGYCAV